MPRSVCGRSTMRPADADLARRSAGAVPRRCAAACSCRSRTGRRSRRTRRRGSRGRRGRARASRARAGGTSCRRRPARRTARAPGRRRHGADRLVVDDAQRHARRRCGARDVIAARTRSCGTSSSPLSVSRSRYLLAGSRASGPSRACAPQPILPFEFGESRRSKSTIIWSSVDWRLRSGLAFIAASTAAPGFFFASSHDLHRRAHEAAAPGRACS